MLVASKKAITRRWLSKESPSKEEWIAIVKEIYDMEKLTFSLNLCLGQIHHVLEEMDSSSWISDFLPQQEAVDNNNVLCFIFSLFSLMLESSAPYCPIWYAFSVLLGTSARLFLSCFDMKDRLNGTKMTEISGPTSWKVIFVMILLSLCNNI